MPIKTVLLEMKERLKTFPDKHKLREFAITSPTLQDLLKVPQVEMKGF